jgi:hypothetical protein
VTPRVHYSVPCIDELQDPWAGPLGRQRTGSVQAMVPLGSGWEKHWA